MSGFDHLYTSPQLPLCNCPGEFCGCLISNHSGRISLINRSGSGAGLLCGKCPRGFRVNEKTRFCEMCDATPHLYDWLYLTSVLIVLFLAHLIAIDWTLRNKFRSSSPTSSSVSASTSSDDESKWNRTKQFVSKFTNPNKKYHCAIILISSVLLELTVSVFLTLFFSEPVGSFTFFTCGSHSLKDWYPIFFNPKVNFSTTLYCTEEIVYPLYTIVLTFFCYDLATMIAVRPLVVWHLNCNVEAAVYIALYFIPVLMLVYAIFAGLFYYSFAYIFLIISVLSVAFNLSLEYSNCSKSIINMLIPPPPRMVVLILTHWGLHIFAVISVMQSSEYEVDGSSYLDLWKVLILTPVPTLFFFLTIRFTDPNEILHRTASVNTVTAPNNRSFSSLRQTIPLHGSYQLRAPSTVIQPQSTASSSSRRRLRYDVPLSDSQSQDGHPFLDPWRARIRNTVDVPDPINEMTSSSITIDAETLLLCTNPVIRHPSPLPM